MTARAELQASAGKIDDALASARKAVDGDPESALAHFALGKVHLLRHEDADALSAFSEALRLNPLLSPAKVEIARLQLGAGRLELAEQMAQSALSDQPASPELRLLAARVDLARGRTARAEPVVRALAKAFPTAPDVQTVVGILELQKRDRPAARAAFGRALAGDPVNIEALRSLVRLDLQDGNTDAARTRVQTALRKQPTNAALLLLSGDTFAATGNMNEAQRIMRTLIEQDPNNLDAYASLGRMYVTTHKLNDAISQFQALAIRQPRSVAIQTTIGVLLQMQNRLPEAQATFERVIQLDSHAAVAANNLAWIYVEQGGNLDIALQLAQTAKTRLSDRPEVNDTLGWVYYKKGLHTLAVEALEQAVERDPKTASYAYHLGAAYAGIGNTGKARAWIEKSIALGLTGADAQAAQQMLTTPKS